MGCHRSGHRTLYGAELENFKVTYKNLKGNSQKSVHKIKEFRTGQ